MLTSINITYVLEWQESHELASVFIITRVVCVVEGTVWGTVGPGTGWRQQGVEGRGRICNQNHHQIAFLNKKNSKINFVYSHK